PRQGPDCRRRVGDRRHLPRPQGQAANWLVCNMIKCESLPRFGPLRRGRGMPTPLSKTYICPDGRDFPVEWPDETMAARTWFFEAEHGPYAQPPFDAALWSACEPGAIRARLEAGFPPQGPWATSLLSVNGFGYYSDVPPSPDLMAERALAAGALTRRYGGI